MEMKEAIETLEELQKFLKKLKTMEEAKTIQKALDEAFKALAYTEFMKGQHSCNDCGRAKECVIKPGWGHVVRINCVNWRGEKEEKRIKACPFCGGTNIHIEKDDDLGSYICCYDCLASFWQQEACSVEDNIKAWNRRAEE